MTRSETMAVLRSGSEHLRRLGATALYLYGSASRDELADRGDVDLFIDYDPQGDFSFVELVRMQEYLATRLNRHVDLTTRSGLHPLLKADIESASVKVF